MSGNESSKVQSGKRHNRPFPIVFTALIASVSCVVLLQIYQKTSDEHSSSLAKENLPISSPLQDEGEGPSTSSNSLQSNRAPLEPEGTADISVTTPGLDNLTTNSKDEAENTALSSITDEINSLETASILPSDTLGDPKKPLQAATEVKNFFAHIDNQPYLEPYSIGDSSKVHFSHVVQKLLDHPPVVSGETRDLYTILQNTAHFFRTAGKDNTLALREIIGQEEDSVETLLENLFLISSSPAVMNNEFEIILDKEALYDYAGYFVSTMGGRLYLFRQNVNLRLLVAYYSIELLNEADKEGLNEHGIDLRQPVASLIHEMESSGDALVKREQYLDNLYEIQQRLM